MVSPTSTEESFFLTSDTTYVRTQFGSAVPLSSHGLMDASALSVGVIINPWDDSYEVEGPVGNGTGGPGTDVSVHVEVDHASLFNWHVVLLTISAFILGIVVVVLAFWRSAP